MSQWVKTTGVCFKTDSKSVIFSNGSYYVRGSYYVYHWILSFELLLRLRCVIAVVLNFIILSEEAGRSECCCFTRGSVCQPYLRHYHVTVSVSDVITAEEEGRYTQLLPLRGAMGDFDRLSLTATDGTRYLRNSQGSRGNTPLHFACLLEKSQTAEALLEYGANPYAENEHGLIPFQLIPKEALRSTKLHFQKIFNVSHLLLFLFFRGVLSSFSNHFCYF